MKKSSKIKKSPHHQRGISLTLSLIMMVLLTLVAVTSFNLGKGDLQLVDNAQQRTQAQTAAQVTLDQVISSSNFYKNPDSVLSNTTCPSDINAPNNSTCIDLYGDGKTVINVALTPKPTCLQTKSITSSQLNLTDSEDLGCTVGIKQNFGVSGSGSQESLCADSLWEINAISQEKTSNAQALITQGVKIRVSIDAVEDNCPET